MFENVNDQDNQTCELYVDSEVMDNLIQPSGNIMRMRKCHLNPSQFKLYHFNGGKVGRIFIVSEKTEDFSKSYRSFGHTRLVSNKLILLISFYKVPSLPGSTNT